MSSGSGLPTVHHALSGPRLRRALHWGATRLPRWVQVATLPVWGALPFAILPEIRRRIALNLRALLGPAPPAIEMVRAYRLLVSFAHSLVRTYAAHGRGIDEATVEISGSSELRAAAALGRGVVLTTGHVGLWQLGPYLLQQAGYPAAVLAMAREPDPSAQAFEEQVALRSRFPVVYTEGPFASLPLLRELGCGGLVAMQMDRAPEETALAVPFAGGQARFAAGPAALARASGAPLVPVFVLAHGTAGLRVEIGAPLEVSQRAERHVAIRAATESVAATYERCVRAHPFQWYASFHPFWTPARDRP